ncbi:hypothetical protein [Streptacidiphilus cavernicola]|uniref:Uncharacterized protein n=1 Tax=Streptacidiphilus cavernicola TaxID=3342716 RepID=A0ABV6VYK2_9ACTN
MDADQLAFNEALNERARAVLLAAGCKPARIGADGMVKMGFELALQPPRPEIGSPGMHPLTARIMLSYPIFRIASPEVGRAMQNAYLNRRPNSVFTKARRRDHAKASKGLAKCRQALLGAGWTLPPDDGGFILFAVPPDPVLLAAMEAADPGTP